MSQGDIGRHVKALEAVNAGEAAAAAKALGTLACDDANRAAIADAGAIAPLVALVTNGSADGQKMAAWVLTNLACDDAILTMIVDAGGIPPLVALLSYGSDESQGMASSTLIGIADGNAANQAAIVAAGAVDPLVELACGFTPKRAVARRALEALDLASITSRLQLLQAENASLKRRLCRMGTEELDSEQPPWRVKTPHPP